MDGPVTATTASGLKLATGTAKANSGGPGAFLNKMYFIYPVNDILPFGGVMKVFFRLKIETRNPDPI